MEKKISVIIPIYNMEKYLSTCLDSVLSQTLKEIEIICINDGSFDKSQEILNEYSWKDRRVKVINQMNQGAAIARNNGIKYATGEFIGFIDPDDYYPDPNTLRDLYNAAKEHNVLICGGSFLENKNGEEISLWSGNLSKYSFDRDGLVCFKDYQFEYGFHRFIYDTSFIKENNLYFPPLTYFEDPVFLVNALSTSEVFWGLKRITYCYRTGHKKKAWTRDKSLDLLKGVLAISELAQKFSYDELLSLERARLENDYMEVLFDTLYNIPDNEIIDVFNKLNKIYFSSSNRLEYFIYKHKFQYIEYDREVDKNKWAEQINMQNQKISDLLKRLQVQEENYEREIEQKKKKELDLVNSISTLRLKNEENLKALSNLKCIYKKQKMFLKTQSKIIREYEERQKLSTDKIQIQTQALTELQNKINTIQTQFYHSTTWKIGNFILIIPKYIKKLITKGINNV